MEKEKKELQEKGICKKLTQIKGMDVFCMGYHPFNSDKIHSACLNCAKLEK